MTTCKDCKTDEGFCIDCAKNLSYDKTVTEQIESLKWKIGSLESDKKRMIGIMRDADIKCYECEGELETDTEVEYAICINCSRLLS